MENPFLTGVYTGLQFLTGVYLYGTQIPRLYTLLRTPLQNPAQVLQGWGRRGEAHSELGDARPLASHGASHRVRSCKSPELPSVAIGSVGMYSRA